MSRASALLVLVAPAVFAQSADTARAGDTTRLPTLTVIGSVIHAMGPSIGSGVPARVTTVDGGEVDRAMPRTLAHLLQRQPGMSLYDDLGSPSKVTLVSRGFTASPVVGLPQGISVFLDGVPVNEPDAGQVNFDLLPLEHVIRMEVLSGTATLAGPHSLGGAVNLITDAGHSRPSDANAAVMPRAFSFARGEANLGVSSLGGFSGVLSARGTMPDAWMYFAGAGHRLESGWRQLTNARQAHGLGSVGRYASNRGVRVQAAYSHSLARTAGSLPFSVYGPRPDSNLSAGDFENLNQVHVALSGYSRLAGGQSSALAFLRRSDAERFNVNQAADPDVRSFGVNGTLGASLDWRRTFSAQAGSLGLRVGVGGSTHDSRVRIHAERIEPGLTTDVESPIAKGDAFSMVDFVTDRVTLSAGARYDVTRIPFRNRLDSSRDTTSVFHEVSPRAGARVALATNASIFASAGRSFRPPALIELACADPNEPCPLPFALGDDPPLAPVRATTIEAGLDWLFSRASLSAVAYRSNVRNDIFLFPYDDANEPDGSTIDGFFANLSRTRREGIELTSRGVVGPLDVFANYAWTRATFQISGVEIFSVREAGGAENTIEMGDRLPLVPTHTLATGASLALGGRVRLGGNAHYTDDRVLRGDEANDEAPLPAFWILDASLAVDIRSWSINLVGRNVLDDRHATFGTFNINQGNVTGPALERFLTPGSPRSIEIAIRRRFGPE